LNKQLLLKIKLTRRAVEDGAEALKEQLERLLLMAIHKPTKTKRSGNGSKKK